MRLHKGNTIRIEPTGEKASFWVVRKRDPKNMRIGMVPHDAAGPFAPSDYRHLTYSRLQEYLAQHVEITVLESERPGSGDAPVPAA